MGRTVLGLVENVKLHNNGKIRQAVARIDTGATKSSLDVSIAAELKLGPIVKQKQVKSASGISIRPVVHTVIEIEGRKIEEEFNIADRSHMKYPILIGQNILKKGEFLIDPLK